MIFKTLHNDKIIHNPYLHWNLEVCAETSDGRLSFVFDDPQGSFYSHEPGVPPCSIQTQQLEVPSIFNGFGCKCGSPAFVPKCLALAKC